MNIDKMLPFRKFNDKREAEVLSTFLTNNNIENTIVDNSVNFNPNMVSNFTDEEYLLKLHPIDFEVAEKILITHASKDLEGIESDYYLYDFTDDELKEVLIKSNEWGAYDVALANEILQQRGVIIEEKELATKKDEHLQNLSKPPERQTSWIVVGYIGLPFCGALSILIGLFLYNQKKTLPDGTVVYEYQEADRKQGKYLFISGIIVLLSMVIFRIAQIHLKYNL